MSSNKSVLVVPERRQSLIFAAMSKALFDLPNEHQTRLEGLWVDDLVYLSTWRKHVSETVEDLKQRMAWVSSITATVVCLLTLLFYEKDFRTSNVSKLPPNLEAQADLVIFSVNLLMMPISHSPALIKSSVLLCNLGLGAAFILFQEQRKLVGTDSATAVSMLKPNP